MTAQTTTGAEPPPCYCLALRQATRSLTQFYDQALAPYGIRVTQYSILSALKRSGPRSINELAAELVMDRTTLGRNIRPLQREGLLRISAHPDDGRSRALAVTARGLGVLAKARGAWQEAQTRFEKSYGGTRAAALRRELQAAAAMDLGGTVAAPAR